MVDTYVRLLCPECEKKWESSPSDLPDAGQSFDCPDCTTTRRLAEFARTGHDLETLKTLG
jgi:predicted RNA-binding Zn-ribbon protein involved in translation (DUF1610 family)